MPSAKQNYQSSLVMDRIKELKEIIKTQTPIAELGHVQAQQEVINAQIELDDLLKQKK